MKPKYRNALPQLSSKLFLTDAGLETELVFHDGMDLPLYESFILLKEQADRDRLHRYFADYAKLAAAKKVGLILETPTWRANRDWAAQLGYDETEIATANRQAVELLCGVRDAYETTDAPVVISGCIGPRRDGYDPGAVLMTASEAEDYHLTQIRTFAETQADMVTVLTMNYVEEAIGVARAAASADVPSVISFTVETDGRLPTGQPLGEAVEAVDDASKGAPAYFMINCAHPTHFADVLLTDEPWVKRLHGIRANASKLSHAELDECDTLDDGDPAELGRLYKNLLGRQSHINVVGGCCGTDYRHVEQICHACAA